MTQERTKSPRRRLGADGAVNRDLMIKAAERLLCTDGYAAVTARRVAEEAGLRPELVFYYFNTMDDLVVGVVRFNAARRRQRIDEALSAADPLRALWELNSDRAVATTTSELLALANHRPSIRAEVVAVARDLRRHQIDAVARILDERGLNDAPYLAGAVVTIGAALGRALAQDCLLGVSEGYAEALLALEHGLRLVRDARPTGNDVDYAVDAAKT